MTPRKVHAVRIDEDQIDALQQIWERDGIQVSEQIRRAVRTWIEAKGIAPTKAERKRAVTRKRS